LKSQLTQEKLADRGIAAVVRGRRSALIPFGARWNEISVGFEQLSDIFGFRVIVKTQARLLPGRSALCTPPGRWCRGASRIIVSTPKANDYHSIHTTVIGPSNQRVELQIRTIEMHELAEYGIAAHCAL